MKGFDKSKLKKQLVSGGVYIALAAAVVTVTLNGVNNIIGEKKDYEIPEVKMPQNGQLKENLTDIPEIFPDMDRTPEKKDTAENNQETLKAPSVFDEPVTIGKEEAEAKNTNEPAYVKDKNVGNSSVVKDTSDVEHPFEIKPETSPASGSQEGVTPQIVPVPEINVSGEPDDVEYPTEPDPVSYDFFAKPAEGYIDKEFSMNELIYSPTMGDFRTHNGVDITGDPGSPVKAINAGTVLDIYFDDFYGNTVKIDHGNDVIAYYMNLSEATPMGLTKGCKVEHGQTIGAIGESAVIEIADVSHLHLSVTKNGEYIDPRELLRNNY